MKKNHNKLLIKKRYDFRSHLRDILSDRESRNEHDFKFGEFCVFENKSFDNCTGEFQEKKISVRKIIHINFENDVYIIVLQ